VRVYISADIEGICGTTHWDECTKDKADYIEFRKQMSAEVAAACNGATAAGAKEIVVQDAHGSARNISHGDLPEGIRLIRGWAGNPKAMVQELDNSFDALLLVGYHSRAGSSGNPLAHSFRGSYIDHMKINEQFASEFLIHGIFAATMDVPTVLVTGDSALCNEVQTINNNITTVAVKEGVGDSTINIHPKDAVRGIWQAAESALQGDMKKCLLPTFDEYSVEIRFKKHQLAYNASYFPGCKLIDSQIVSFDTKDFFEVLRMIQFVIK
jgi:D-amino peptidase